MTTRMQKKIVIVEDDLILQELHMHYATNLGHEVIGCFQDGISAAEFFKENSADLILMDIRLEGNIDGVETASLIQQIQNVPIIYVSANTNDSIYGRALSTNMKGYLAKPLSPNELDQLINQITELTDSIIYSERIQKQLFAKEEELRLFLQHCFLINRPKDIVTGDFCFIGGSDKNKELIIAVGDCTGHGVPGALLSIVCYNILTNLTDKLTNLCEINNKIYVELEKIMNSNSSISLYDSLDLCIFKLTKGNSEIEITGHKRECIYYNSIKNEHEIIKFKGLKESILTPPVLTKINYRKGDFFYFYSDGITDQFGGDLDKKLTRKRLISFLDSDRSNTDIELKKSRLSIFLRKWQGSKIQTDDMIFLAMDPNSNNAYLTPN